MKIARLRQELNKNGSETSDQPGSLPAGKSNKHRQSRKAEEEKNQKPKGGDKSESDTKRKASVAAAPASVSSIAASAAAAAPFAIVDPALGSASMIDHSQFLTFSCYSFKSYV